MTTLYIIFFFSLFVVTTGLFLKYKEHNEKKLNQKEAEARKKESLESIANGNWKFPSLEFVKQCVDEGFISPNKNLTDMQDIAKEILNREEIPTEYHDLYCSKKNIVDYFEREYYTPKKSKPRNIKVFYMVNGVAGVTVDEQFIYSLKDLTEKNKREYMLKYFLKVLSSKNAEYLETTATFDEHARKARASYINPAIAGGLGNAIGGIGGGLYAANQMAELNKQSEQQAQVYTNRAYFSYTEAVLAEKAITKFEKELSALKRKKIYDEYSTEDIFKHFSIKTRFSLDDDKLNLYINIDTDYIKSTNYTYGIPNNLFPGVVDGTLSAYIYMKNKLVYEYVLPFGIFGHKSGFIGNDNSYDIENTHGHYTIPIYFLGKNREKDIKIEIKPNHLWIMSE